MTKQIKKLLIGSGFIAIIMTMLLGIQIASASGWYNSSWQYRNAITIDHAKVGNGTENETDFPVLISLSGLSNINSNGSDIRFTLSDGTTELAREIEYYSSGTLVAWVKIPTLSCTEDTVIYMYYGNSSATEPATTSTYGSQNVWTNNYSGVWHLKETGTSTTSDYKDSTSNSNNSTNTSVQPTATTGKIDGAELFANSSISVGDAADFSGAFTANFWAYNTGVATTSQTFLAKNLNSSSLGWIIYEGTDQSLNFSKAGASTSTTSYASMTAGWNYVSAIYNGSLMNLYLNGSLVGQATETISDATTIPLLIGSAYNDDATGTANYDSGIIDETRMSSVTRTAGWIATEYANQNSPTTFTTLSSQEVVDIIAPTNVGISSAVVDSPYQVTITALEATDSGSGLATEAYQFKRTYNGTATEFDWQSSNIFTDSLLNAKTTYQYSVRVKDAMGNISEYSTSVSVTTRSESSGGNYISDDYGDDTDVTTKSATDISENGATLRGNLDLDDDASDYAYVYFQWGTTKDLGKTTDKEKLKSSKTFEAELDDLKSDKKYYYRAIAKTEAGKTTYGSIKYFITEEAVEDDEETSDSSEIEQLKAQIKELSAQIAKLLEAISASNITTINTSQSYQFSTDLSLGSNSEAVRQLQIFLNNHGFTVAISGNGSAGNESYYYGNLTESAVKKFQQYYGITPANGIISGTTKTKINSILSE